jgi:hypothetical protein
MDWFELFGRIFACILEDDLLTPGVFCEILAYIRAVKSSSEETHTREEFGYIVGFAVHDDPARVFGVVLGDICAGELACHFEEDMRVWVAGE